MIPFEISWTRAGTIIPE